jgi:hypothetical protein
MLCMPFGGDQLVVAQHIKDHGYGLQVCRIGCCADRSLAIEIHSISSCGDCCGQLILNP